MWATELFENILDNPSPYVGKPSLPLIHAYIEGFCLAKLESADNGMDNLYSNFDGWVADRFHLNAGPINKRTAYNWAEILVFFGRSEAAAFELAKQLWEE